MNLQNNPSVIKQSLIFSDKKTFVKCMLEIKKELIKNEQKPNKRKALLNIYNWGKFHYKTQYK